MVILVLVLAAAVLALAFQLARWRAELLRLARQLTDLPENSNQELHCSVRAKPFLALCSALEDHLWAARQSAADARRAQRELQYAIAAVSHDIRTPLTGAAGYLQLAQACPDPEKRGEYLGVVRGRLHDLEGLLEFYVLLQLRALLRERGAYAAAPQPKLDTLLPLVALGTVADVVRLDANNRRLVDQGLLRIRKGHMPAGMLALYQAAGKTWQQAGTQDFGFALGPRINAAGRLADMTIGIECLLTDDFTKALELAEALDRINRQRQSMEGDMRQQAFVLAEALCQNEGAAPAAISVFDPEFHEGVVGIVASRIKDRLHRPTFVFAASQAEGKTHELKGSGRSIPGFHLRDALDLVAKRHPDVLLRFGGHAMAAGCTIAADNFERFSTAFAQVAQELLSPQTLTRCLHTDGPLPPQFRQSAIVEQLNLQVWGQGFEPPTFSEDMEIVSQRLVGEKHLKLQLRHQGDVVDGIWFGRTEPLDGWAHLAFRLDINEWKGERKVQFLVEGAEGA